MLNVGDFVWYEDGRIARVVTIWFAHPFWWVEVEFNDGSDGLICRPRSVILTDPLIGSLCWVTQSAHRRTYQPQPVEPE